MRCLFSTKKDVLGLLLLCAIAVLSCTNEDEVLKSNKVEPGIYTIERTIDAQNVNAETRGVQSNNDFDMNYDPEYIYLHCGGEALYIPVYTYCSDCAAGFRYRVEVQNDGNAILTPIDEDGGYMDKTLTIPQGSSCYFSSLESDEWELQESQITKNGIVLDNITFTSYSRRSDINKEIYRSESNYTIDNLVTNGDLTVVRACAGFNLVGLFYDGDEASGIGDDGGIAILDASEFANIMGDAYTNWYIKILIGGDAFTEKYDLSKNESVGETGGYYTSGDADLYASGESDVNKYLQFSQRSYGSGDVTYSGFGYYTRSGNHLFTPVTGSEVEVYVMIKHWTGTEDPCDTWLLSDDDAIYTQVNLSGTSIPINNSFYTIGLLMNIYDFKTAWSNAGVDSSSVGFNASTKSLGLKASREFFLKDTKVIFESY